MQITFTNDLRTKMAVAGATAQLFAVIAANMRAGGPATLEEYQQRIVYTVINYAPVYFATVNQNWQDGAQITLIPENVALSGFTVSGSDGSRLLQSGSDVMLLSRGAPWLGGGKILGNDYFVDVVIINEPRKQKNRKSGKH